jgi:hypothetical protein
MKISFSSSASFFLSICSLLSCNLDVNTSDPQASCNIQNSKKDRFFIAGYELSEIHNQSFNISEAWVESVWFNKLTSGRVSKIKSNEYQLVLKIKDFLNPEFDQDKYLSKWEMQDDQGNVFGSGNGVYILLLKGNGIPDTFHISIRKIEENLSTTKVAEFLLARTK